MLLNFSVTNWKCYRNEATMNLVASREKQHSETLARIDGFRTMKALPVAAVYGGNSSGKTGFFDALAALRYLVVEGCGIDETIPVQPFLLDETGMNEDTVFDITFLKCTTVYRLYVSANRQVVTYESLEIVRDRTDGVLLYELDRSSGVSYFDEKRVSDAERVRFVMEGTRENQLFINAAVNQNLMEFREPYEWFSKSLIMLDTRSHASAFATSVTQRQGFLEFVSRKLQEYDTGVIRVAGDPMEVSQIPLSPSNRKTLANLKDGMTFTVVYEGNPGNYDFEMYVVTMDNGVQQALRLLTYHRGKDGSEAPFRLSAESSGTQRLMGLMPMLFDIANDGNGGNERVYVVDELDRCLHTMLTAHLIAMFLECSGARSRKQLLFTTHDLLLMDQSLLRRDEMYLTQRDNAGVSEMIGLNEYQGIRNDKNLIRSYLDGRFGGIPMFSGGALR